MLKCWDVLQGSILGPFFTTLYIYNIKHFNNPNFRFESDKHNLLWINTPEEILLMQYWTNNIYHKWGVFFISEKWMHMYWYTDRLCFWFDLLHTFASWPHVSGVGWIWEWWVGVKFIRSFQSLDHGLAYRHITCIALQMFLSIFSHLEEQHIYCQCPLLPHCDAHLSVAAAIAGAQAYCFLYCYDNHSALALVKHSLLECTNRLITHSSFLKT